MQHESHEGLAALIEDKHPAWQIRVGDFGILYARKREASPAVLVRAMNAHALREKINRADAEAAEAAPGEPGK